MFRIDMNYCYNISNQIEKFPRSIVKMNYQTLVLLSNDIKNLKDSLSFEKKPVSKF